MSGSNYPAGAGYPTTREVVVQCANDDCPAHDEEADRREEWTASYRDSGLGFGEVLYPYNSCPVCDGTDLEVNP